LSKEAKCRTADYDDDHDNDDDFEEECEFEDVLRRKGRWTLAR
jgi:hypothetical protein